MNSVTTYISDDKISEAITFFDNLGYAIIKDHYLLTEDKWKVVIYHGCNPNLDSLKDIVDLLKEFHKPKENVRNIDLSNW